MGCLWGNFFFFFLGKERKKKVSSLYTAAYTAAPCHVDAKTNTQTHSRHHANLVPIPLPTPYSLSPIPIAPNSPPTPKSHERPRPTFLTPYTQHLKDLSTRRSSRRREVVPGEKLERLYWRKHEQKIGVEGGRKEGVVWQKKECLKGEEEEKEGL